MPAIFLQTYNYHLLSLADFVLGALHPAEAAQLRGRGRHREAVPGGRRAGLLHGDAPQERDPVLAGQGQRAVAQVNNKSIRMSLSPNRSKSLT